MDSHAALLKCVENYEKFKQDLQRLKYSGKFASQEKQENSQIIYEDKSINSSGNNQSLESSKPTTLYHDDSNTSFSSEAKIVNVQKSKSKNNTGKADSTASN